MTSISTEGGKIISGSKDFKIAIISSQTGGNFKLERLIDLGTGTLLQPKSVDFFNGNLLVGLRNGTIIEYPKVLESGDSTPEQRVLMSSHFEGETWGLCVLDDNTVVTSGDDNRINLFDTDNKKFIRGGKVSENKMKDLAKKSTASSMSQFPPNKQSRAVCVSMKHNHLVVCSNMGKTSIRDFSDFDKKVCSLKQAKEWSEVASYSPCENYLAIGSHDNKIYIYTINEAHEYSIWATADKHSSFVNSMDWSTDSKWIRSTSGDYNTHYFDVLGKCEDARGNNHSHDETWATQSLKLGKDRAGIKPAGEDGTHINNVTISPDGGLLVTGDDYGLVNVYNYPVEHASSASRSFSAHSEHVVRVQFSKDGKRLFSLGGQDKTLVQWRIKPQ